MMGTNIKKVFAVVLLSGLMGSAMADWGYHYHHYRPWHYHHYHYYHDNGDLAAGLVVGGMVGLLAGSAMASGPHYYQQTNYYTPAPVCYKRKAWSRRFCDDGGCYVKTVWRTVCN